MKSNFPKMSLLSPTEIAKYYLCRAIEDGDLITPLKMQKLVYYAYVWVLVREEKRIFDEYIEAWPNGPVIPSLYHSLKIYGSSPISGEFCDIEKEDLINSVDKDLLETIDIVYEKYIPLSAFELVVLTHSELPWKNARKGLLSTQKSNKKIRDEDIIDQFLEESK